MGLLYGVMQRLCDRAARRPAFWPGVIACAALAAILAALDPTGDHPGGFDGPGLTVDEPINVAQGVALVDRLLDGDWEGYLKADASVPDHPPLARLWIGLCHELAYLVWPPITKEAPYSIACARVAPAIAFSLTVFLVGWKAGRWYGPFAGAAAAGALVLMPRPFGHAHLAALESCINLAYASVVLYLADHWADHWADAPSGNSATLPPSALPERNAPSMQVAVVGGVLLGLALLTKVQAILLPPPVALWALLVWRRRAVVPLVVWGLVALAVLYLGWPYLLAAPIDHLQRYLGRTTNRAAIQVWYFGQAMADRDVPWHYPWVLFATTVPLGLHLLGLWGVARIGTVARRSPRDLLVLTCLLFPLVVFSLPGVVVYDGERLFSVSFPLWAVVIGKGAEAGREWLSRRMQPGRAAAILMALLTCQGIGLVVAGPCWLSYYNLAVGGLGGASRLGLPTTYWGDSLTRTLLRETAQAIDRKSKIGAAPTLVPGQWDELLVQCPPLLRQEIQFNPDGSGDEAWRLVFDRQEYLPRELRQPLEEGRIVAAVRRSGVVLAALYQARPR
ncbi:MAG: hypothetical protein ACT4QC_10675 [Planctomycetaceae bacterium]